MARAFDCEKICRIIGYTFKDQSLVELAFTHSSFAHQYGISSNERLEFLGDAILDFIVAERLYTESGQEEGYMSKMRARLVSTDTLSSAIRKMGLDRFLHVGDSLMGGKPTISMMEDLFEAIVGAIYIDGGIDSVKRFVETHIDFNQTDDTDYKTRLQEIVQKAINSEPEYISSDEPNNNRDYTTRLVINGIVITEQEGRSKKISHMKCAKYALDNIHLVKKALDRK